MRVTEMPEWKRIKESYGEIIGIHDAEAEALHDAARGVPDGECVVEIGSFLGKSTYSLASGCVGRGVKVYAVDTFMGSPGGLKEWKFGSGFKSLFEANLKEMIAGGIVVPLEMSSAGALMVEPPIRPSLIFVDGSHQYHDVLFDMTAWWQRLKQGGVMAVHDSTGDQKWHPQVKAALDHFRRNHPAEWGGLKDSISWLRKP